VGRALRDAEATVVRGRIKCRRLEVPFDETGYVLIMTSSRTRVLFLIPTLTGGGAERVFVTLLRHLDRSRFPATVILISLPDAVFRDDLPAQLHVIDPQCSRVRKAIPKIGKAI